MALLTTQNPSPSGGTIAMVAAAGGGDTFNNVSGKTALMVVNGGGSAITVTLDAPGTCNFGAAANAAHDLAVSVAAGQTKIIGPALDPARFNNGSDIVSASYSGVTSVTVAAVKF